jgi:hypothetical protein
MKRKRKNVQVVSIVLVVCRDCRHGGMNSLLVLVVFVHGVWVDKKSAQMRTRQNSELIEDQLTKKPTPKSQPMRVHRCQTSNPGHPHFLVLSTFQFLYHTTGPPLPSSRALSFVSCNAMSSRLRFFGSPSQ